MSDQNEAFAALVKRDPHWLARPMSELVKLQAVGSVYLASHRQLLRKIKSGEIVLAEADKKAKLADGQAIGEALLDVEAKIGELSPPAKDSSERGRKGVERRVGGFGPLPTREKDSLKAARAIHAHPAAVEAVKREARENDDIPTKTAVLNKIKLERTESLNAKLREKMRAKEAPKKAAPEFGDVLDECIYKATEILAVVEMIPPDVSNLMDADGKKLARLAGLIIDIVKNLREKKGSDSCKKLTATL